jgi:hypothetical protein
MGRYQKNRDAFIDLKVILKPAHLLAITQMKDGSDTRKRKSEAFAWYFKPEPLIFL